MSQVQTNLSGLEDRFQIHSELGTGGTGSVFEALDLVLMRKVAIKVLHAGFDGSAAARFQREAQATSRLNNPNLVHVLDFGVDTAGKPYLVMEYLEGEDLVNVLKNNGALPTTKVLEIALQLCGALAHAHEKGILHRDLKPSNIIMQRTDEGERVKLVDFGLAKLLDSNQSLTTSGATVGTVSYISPEMANGKAVDERSDLYSLGCVLFECLTGTPPFRGETVHQTLLMHSQSSPPRLSCANVSFPRFVESMVEKLLEKNPDKRYQTAREVQTDIEGYLNSLEENRNQPADTDEEQHPSIIPDYANTLRSGLLGSPESADLPDVSKKRKALSTRKIAISISILLMALIGAIAFGALNLNRQEAGQLPKLPQSSLDDSFPESPPINGVSAAEKAEKQLSRYDAEEWNMMTKKQVTAFVNANDDDRAVVGDLEAGSFSRVFVERRAITRRFAKALLQDSHLKHLEFLKCSGLTDDLLLKLAKQTKLETIALREMNVNDDTLKTIAKITSLRAITLDNNQTLTGSGLASLYKHPNLLRLSLGGTGVKLKALQSFLDNKPPTLRNIRISNLNLGDKEIETLNLKHIATLYLSGNPITINSLEYLSRFPSIRHLHLRGCVGVNDKCFVPLSKLNLITLSLAATNVSTLEGLDKLRTVQSLFLEECMKLNDLSLEQLVALRLRTLNLSGTNITDQGLKTIAKLKPKTATVDVSLKGCPNITVAGRTYLKQHANIEIAEDDYGLD